MADRKIGFGVIGCGVAASYHINGVLDAEGAELIAVSDIVEARAQEFGAKYHAAWYTDHHDLLKRDDIDVVSICTPSGLRRQVVLDAAEAKKPLIVEKPIDITLEGADAIIQVAEQAGVKLMCIFQLRCGEAVTEVRRAIHEGRLGRIVLAGAYIKWYRSQEYYDSGAWRGTWDMEGGGALMTQGIHTVDLLQWIMGPVSSVYARMGTLVHNIEVEDTLAAVLTFGNGALGTIEATTASHPGMPAKLEFYGEKGTIVVEADEITVWEVQGEEGPPIAAKATDVAKAASDSTRFGDEGHKLQIKDMVRAIKAVTTHRGRDPRDFVLMAFGGSGGVHAVALARELRIGRVMVPPVAGVFSALGLLLADAQVNISRACLKAVDELHHEDANEIYDDLEDQATDRIGGDRSTIRFERFVDMRYTGQAYELTIPLPAGPICAASRAELSDAFEQAHERSYGHSFSGGYSLEAVNLRVVATRPTPRPPRIRLVCEGAASKPGLRMVHFGARFGAVETPILDRHHLTAEPAPGPCIIEDVEGTIVVPPDCSVSVDLMSTVLVELNPS